LVVGISLFVLTSSENSCPQQPKKEMTIDWQRREGKRIGHKWKNRALDGF
jgi:hypothetical protein